MRKMSVIKNPLCEKKFQKTAERDKSRKYELLKLKKNEKNLNLIEYMFHVNHIYSDIL